MKTTYRWNLIGPFVLALGLALYAQYLFAQRDAVWYDSVLLYIVAGVLFVYVARRAFDSPPVAQAARGNFLGSLARLVELPRERFVLVATALLSSAAAAWMASRTEQGASFALPIGLWLGAIIIFCAAFFPWKSAGEGGAQDMWAALGRNRAEVLLVVAIGLLGLLLRVWSLGDIPISLGGDEAEMGLQAKEFIAGRMRNPFAKRRLSTSWMPS